MIKKEKSGFVVYSEEGERLSKPLPSYSQALDRLKQIEYYKTYGKTRR